MFLGLGLVAASDINMDENISLTEHAENIQTTSNNNDMDVANENHNTMKISSKHPGSERAKDDNDILNFSSLNETINSGSSEITLDNNYIFNEEYDSRFIDLGGIVISQNLTIDGKGHTIDLCGKVRFLNITGHTVTLKNINIVNGNTSLYGGAIYIFSGNGNFVNSTFSNNNAKTYGGAIYIKDGYCNISNSTFNNNNASSNGGAIYLENGKIIVDDSTFQTNKAKTYGGAIYIKNVNCNMTKSTFNNNNASSNGGAIFIDGNGTFIKATFNNNNAQVYGGAIYIKEKSKGYFIYSTFTGNYVKSDADTGCYGGGIYIATGNCTILNSTFNNNMALNDTASNANGSAVYVKGNCTVINSTFNNNNGTSGSIYILRGNGKITDTIFSGNWGNINGGGLYVNLGNCTIENTRFENNSALTYAGAIYMFKSNLTCINSTITANSAKYVGGVYITNGIAYIENSTLSDNNGTQFSGALYVNGNATILNTSFTDNNGIEGGAIYINNGHFTIINSKFRNNKGTKGGSIYITKTTVILTNSSFLENNAMNGSAVFNNIGNITFNYCNLTDNYANDSGGAIYINKGNGYFIFTKFENNNGNNTGGAIFIQTGNGTFTNSSFTGNNAGVYGGALYLNNSTSIFNNCTVSDNYAPSAGGIYLNDGILNITTSKFTNNIEGNIIYTDNINNIKVYKATKTASDPNLIQKFTEITVEVKDYTYETIGYVTFYVCDLNMELIGEGNVTVYVDDEEYTNISGGFGVVELQGINAGNHTISIIYGGSANYAKALSEILNFTVNKQTIDMYTEADNITYGEDELIKVFVYKNISGIIYLIYNEQIYSANLTNGIGTINIPNLNADNYTFNVIFNGTENYDKSVSTVNFEVKPQATSITSKNANYVINYDNIYSVTVNPQVSNVNIIFTVNGVVIGTGLSDASGISQIKITSAQLKKLGAGTHNIIAIFEGDENHIGSNGTGKITINKEASKLVNVKTSQKSYKSTAKKMQLTATLKDSKNKVIKNQLIYFKIKNKTFKVKTNSKGIATLTLNGAKIKALKLNKKGNYKFTVTYKPTATYKQATGKGTIKVSK